MSAYHRLLLYLAFEPHIRGRSVAEIGCGTGEGSDFLLQKGARAVYGMDPDPDCIAQARRRYERQGLTFLRWEPGAEIPLPPESLDLVVVPEGADWLRRPDFLQHIRRLLDPHGALLVAAPSAERIGSEQGISYYELVDALQPFFEHISMVGQTPFSGYSLIEYVESAEEPELALDTSLVEGQVPEVSHYIAWAGPDTVALGGMTLVQLPAFPAELEHLPREEELRSLPGQEPNCPPLGIDVRAHDERLALLEGERQGFEWRVRELEGRLLSSERKAQAQIEELEERVKAREEALARAAEAADLHRRELEDREAALAERTAYVTELEQELARLRKEERQLQTLTEQTRTHLREAEAQAREARKRAAEIEGKLMRAQATTTGQRVDGAVAQVSPADPTEPRGRSPDGAELEERLALAESQTAVWMTKFNESERKAEEARSLATRKLLDAKAVAASQLQRSIDESSRKLASVTDELGRSERDRREALLKVQEAERRADASSAESAQAARRIAELEQRLKQMTEQEARIAMELASPQNQEAASESTRAALATLWKKSQ